MSRTGWSYRLDMIDGPTRCGQLEKDGIKIPFPILLDPGAIDNDGIAILLPDNQDLLWIAVD